ncbi:LysR family transcriptional regulator [Halomonas sp. HAL1]|uniref:LysR family transcriptional regulator n=1 Tax=Halomonas sp. HAL1 TaxID=550984 RepID=UPI00022D33B7|nr:LysR family transcriptional regulator [Halomonas sp. HAL1]EHA15926.1 LysR family transcriptional regulator [Halomonas sp. HAL1]WKV93807.1 LysR family transcriptional regulator [Halomonas sp. HAL1]
MKNLDDLEAFVRVVDSGDFSSAARSLNLTAGAISKQIKRLEGSLGVTLFDRSTRRIRVTEEGLKIYECIKRGLGSIHEAFNIAEQGREYLTGNIAISSPSTFNDHFLIEAIGEFKKYHPSISFYLDSSNRMVDLYSDGIDIAIRSGQLSDSQLVARRAFEQNRILVCSPDYLKKITLPSNAQDIYMLNSLVFGYPGFNSTYWTLENINNGEVHKVPIKKEMVSDDGRALLNWALQGHGVALRESWGIKKYLISGELVNILPEWQEPATPIQVVRTMRNPVPMRVSMFSNFLIEFCQDKLKA